MHAKSLHLCLTLCDPAWREGGNRGWGGWMWSLTQWTWVWVTPGDGEGQGSLAYCSTWDHKQSDTTEWLNNNNMDCSPSGSSGHRILQARIPEAVAMPSSRGSSRPRDWTCVSYVSCIDRWILYCWATREAQNIVVTILYRIISLPTYWWGDRIGEIFPKTLIS